MPEGSKVREMSKVREQRTGTPRSVLGLVLSLLARQRPVKSCFWGPQFCALKKEITTTLAHLPHRI